MVLGGKWLPFSPAGGIPMFVTEPHWWCINMDSHMTWQGSGYLRPSSLYYFLARAFVPIKNDCIWSFNSQPLISVSMAAKLSDLGDKTSEANLQVDGQVEKPAQGAADQCRRWKKRMVPLLTCRHVVPCPEAAIRPPQYETLPRNMSDFNRWIGKMYPHHHMLGWHQWWKICCKKQELDSLRQ